MFIQDRETGRRFFFRVWQKYGQKKTQLEPLEELVLGVILEHPEYHHYLRNEEEAVNNDFVPEAGGTNPFLHMSMHIAIKEQIGADRPAGISDLYRQLLEKKWSDTHELEHNMMECLGESLWVAQRNNAVPDELAYMECLKRLKQ
jgi:hypothetical protein